MPLTRRLPKRGFYNKFEKTYAVVNLSMLEKFDNGAEITPELLLDMGLVNNKNNVGVKVLADGQLTKSLTVYAHKFSAKAKQAIESAGGKAEVIE